MQFTVRERYACGVARFWDTVFFAPEFNEPLYREALGFDRYEVVQLDRDAAGGVSRRIRVMPRLDAPAAIKKLVGDALVYEEHGRFDPLTRHFKSRLVPSRLADQIRIEADLWLEPLSPSTCERLVRFEVEARLLGLGRVVEKFVERTLRENYAKSAAFTNRWLETHPESSSEAPPAS